MVVSWALCLLFFKIRADEWSMFRRTVATAHWVGGWVCVCMCTGLEPPWKVVRKRRHNIWLQLPRWQPHPTKTQPGNRAFLDPGAWLVQSNSQLLPANRTPCSIFCKIIDRFSQTLFHSAMQILTRGQPKTSCGHASSFTAMRNMLQECLVQEPPRLGLVQCTPLGCWMCSFHVQKRPGEKRWLSSASLDLENHINMSFFNETHLIQGFEICNYQRGSLNFIFSQWISYFLIVLCYPPVIKRGNGKSTI